MAFKSVLLILLILPFAYSVQIGEKCVNDASECGSNLEIERLKCTNMTCAGTYLNNNCKNSTGCGDGFYCHSTGICDYCMPNCAFCNDSLSCSQCQEGFLYNGTHCNPLIENCKKATNLLNCTECSLGSFLEETGICTKCSSKCLNCTSLKDCSRCDIGYYWDDVQIECMKGIPNCEIMNTTGKSCVKCIKGFYEFFINKETGLCKQSPLNCDINPTLGACKECKTGYYLNETSLCDAIEVSSCQKTTTGKDCVECKEGYFLQKTCGDRIPNCLRMKSQGACDECEPGYYVNSTKKCAPCYDSKKCSTCTNNTREECQTCSPGFIKVEESKCVKCEMSGCKTCNLYGPNKCDSVCVEGFFMNKTEICYSCPEGCATCESATKCTAPKPGYITYTPDGGAQQILKCTDPNCVTCDPQNLDFCHTCKDGFFWSEPKFIVVKHEDDTGVWLELVWSDTAGCSPCVDYCKTCTAYDWYACTEGLPRTYFDADYTFFYGCPEHCHTCDNYFTCQEDGCDPDSFFSYGTCYQCCDNCEECYEGSCYTCKDGYYLDQNSCVPCMEGCRYCDGPDSCYECLDQYTLDMPCVSCPTKNCNYCDEYEPEMCYSCAEGFYMSIDVCEPCSADCKYCPSKSVCEECYPGTHLNETTFACDKCIEGCAKCENQLTCKECKPGFYLTYDNICSACKGNEVAVCNPPPMDSYGRYIDNSDTATVACNSYVFTTDTCIPVANCMTPSSPNKCQQCKSGFYLTSTYTCSPCMKNCAVCRTSAECRECVDKYYLTGEPPKCESCKEGCAKCSSATVCTACDRAYTLVNNTCNLCKNSTLGDDCTCGEGEYWNGNSCSNCQAGCSVCRAAKECKVCLKNYYMDKGKCTKSSDPNCYSVYPFGTCKQCLPTYYYDDNANLCKECSVIPNCYLCANGAKCTTCESGYYPSGGVCVECKQNLANCMTCSSQDVCNLCELGYFTEKNGKCYKCREGCKYCSKYTNCFECELGYYKDVTGLCKKCGLVCNKCTSPTNCTDCAPKYYVHPQYRNCTACHPLCGECNGPTVENCTLCIDGAEFAQVTIDLPTEPQFIEKIETVNETVPCPVTNNTNTSETNNTNSTTPTICWNLVNKTVWVNNTNYTNTTSGNKTRIATVCQCKAGSTWNEETLRCNTPFFAYNSYIQMGILTVILIGLTLI